MNYLKTRLKFTIARYVCQPPKLVTQSGRSRVELDKFRCWYICGRYYKDGLCTKVCFNTECYWTLNIEHRTLLPCLNMTSTIEGDIYAFLVVRFGYCTRASPITSCSSCGYYAFRVLCSLQVHCPSTCSVSTVTLLGVCFSQLFAVRLRPPHPHLSNDWFPFG